MQIPQLQRNNNSGNSKTNHNTEGYCLAFAYLLDNYNLLIMPILFRTMSLCSNNNAHIRNCHSALFQFKWKQCCLGWQSKTETFIVLKLFNYNSIEKDEKIYFIKQIFPVSKLWPIPALKINIQISIQYNLYDTSYMDLLNIKQANKSRFYFISLWISIATFSWRNVSHCDYGLSIKASVYTAYAIIQ